MTEATALVDGGAAADAARVGAFELSLADPIVVPAILPERGLGPAMAALAANARVRLAVVDAPPDRLERAVEECAYFCVAAAAAESAGPIVARFVRGRTTLHLTMKGADLPDDVALELRDRVEAIGGAIVVTDEATGIEPPAG